MRIGSLILSLLALSGLLPFGKIDAAVLATEQPATIGESLAKTPARVQSLGNNAFSLSAENETLTLTHQLAIAVLALPASAPSTLPTTLPTPSAPVEARRLVVCNTFGEIAINAP